MRAFLWFSFKTFGTMILLAVAAIWIAAWWASLPKAPTSTIPSSNTSGLNNVLTNTSTFIVKMGGTAKTNYTLTCMVMQPGGSSSSQSTVGTVPFEYSFTGNMVSCVGQKKNDYGEVLRMDITKAGAILQTSSTNAPYGVTQAATQ